jgi:GxxExxY protein
LQRSDGAVTKTLAFSVGAAIATNRVVPINVNDYNHVTGPILSAAIEVHKHIGPGMLGSTYMTCLQYELKERRLRFDVQRPMPVIYKTLPLGPLYRIDLVVEECVVVEVKSNAGLLPIHEAQILTNMRLADCPVGLLINFNVPRLMDGVKRRVNPRAGEP